MGCGETLPGELETLRADNVRLRRLLMLSEEQARAADPDQAALTGAPTTFVDMGSTPEDKIRFCIDLFRCRTDVYAVARGRLRVPNGWPQDPAVGSPRFTELVPSVSHASILATTSW